MCKSDETIRSRNERSARKSFKRKCKTQFDDHKDKTKIMVIDLAGSLPQTYCPSTREWILLLEKMVAQQKKYGGG